MPLRYRSHSRSVPAELVHRHAHDDEGDREEDQQAGHAQPPIRSSTVWVTLSSAAGPGQALRAGSTDLLAAIYRTCPAAHYFMGIGRRAGEPDGGSSTRGRCASRWRITLPTSNASNAAKASQTASPRPIQPAKLTATPPRPESSRHVRAITLTGNAGRDRGGTSLSGGTGCSRAEQLPPYRSPYQGSTRPGLTKFGVHEAGEASNGRGTVGAGGVSATLPSPPEVSVADLPPPRPPGGNVAPRRTLAGRERPLWSGWVVAVWAGRVR